MIVCAYTRATANDRDVPHVIVRVAPLSGAASLAAAAAAATAAAAAAAAELSSGSGQ